MLSRRLAWFGLHARKNHGFHWNHPSNGQRLNEIHLNDWTRAISIISKEHNRCTDHCSSWEFRALLTIGSKHELYRYLSRLTLSKEFLFEIEHILEQRDLCAHLDFTKLLRVADVYTWNSVNTGVEKVRRYAEKQYFDQYNEYGTLLSNASLCENIDKPLKAMNIQMTMASEGVWPTVAVLAQVELLLNKVILCRSRALVTKIYQFIMNFKCPNMRGPLLCSSWVSFYTSPYQCDWTLADDLLEANEEEMLPHLDSTLLILADHLLDGRKLNRYCSLLQSFSRASHKQKTKKLIELLYRHYYSTNNIEGCWSCIRLSRDLKVHLSADIMYKFETIKITQPFKTRADLLYRF